MSLLYRQFFHEITKTFILILGVLLALIIIGRVVQLRDIFLGLDIGLLDTIVLFIYMTPVSLMLLVPVSCMLAAFLTFLRMSTDRELIALRAGGISILQMLPAPMVFSVLCMLLTLWVSLFGLGWGMGNFRSMLMDIATTRARIVVQPGVFNVDFPGLTLFARQVHPDSGLMAQVLVDDRTNPTREILMLAPTGRIDMDYEQGDIVFSLENGTIYSSSDEDTSILSFENYQVRLPLEKLFKNLYFTQIRPQDMTWSQLFSDTVRLDSSKNENYANRIEVEKHKRWAYPMACIILTLFAIPLAAIFEGLHRQTALALAFAMFFVYYIMMSFGFSTGETGVIPPYLALWLPNILFLCGALYGLRLALYERVPHIVLWVQNMRKREKMPSSGVLA